MIKRLFDIALSSVALLILSPLLVAISLWVRSDGGPVLYRGKRVARGGGLFDMLKFRTMVVDAEKIGGSSTPEDDPRVTRVGRFLRRHKLDELPQLINVLRGDMSFVGPRPQVKWVVDLYSDEERRVLTLRPGITDYASLKFSNEGEILRGSTDPDKDYFEKIHPEKMRLSLKYVDESSLAVDVRIILRTALAVLR